MFRNNIILKSSLRQVVLTLFFAILIGMATFFFVSRTVEYQIVTTETERIGSFYRSIGFFTSTHGTDLTEMVEIISKDPRFDFGAHSRNIFASINGMHNTDFSGRGYFADSPRATFGLMDIDSFFYGELINKRGPSFTVEPYYTLEVLVDSVLEGYPEHVLEGYRATIRWRIEDGVEELFAQLEVGKRYFFNTTRSEGGRWAGLCAETDWHYLRLLNEDAFLWFVHVEEIKEIDFKNPLFSHIPEQLELLHVNQRAKWITTSMDMSAMPQTQEIADMWFLMDGRWLNHEDYATMNHVTVVNFLFAQIRGLTIGDTITLTLRDVEIEPLPLWASCCGGVIPLSNDNWQEQETYEATFEIVGLFSHGRRIFTYSAKTRELFVPDSIAPAIFGATDRIPPLLYSFVLTCTKYQEAFLLEYYDMALELGFRLQFLEHGAERFWEAVEPVLRSLVFNAVLFAGVFLATIVLIVLLYIKQRQREFAILRALGCHSKKAIRQLFTPILVLWLPFILLGSVVGWNSAHQAAAVTLESVEVEEEYQELEDEINLWLRGGDRGGFGEENQAEEEEQYLEIMTPALTIWWFVALFIVALIIPLLVVLVGSLYVSHRPVLEMLQGYVTKTKSVKRKGKRKEASTSVQRDSLLTPPEPLKEQSAKIFLGPDLLSNLEISKRNMQNAIWMSVLRYIIRSPIKTILTMSIAILVVLAIGWLQRTIRQGDEEIDRLFDTTVVRGEIRPFVHDDFDPRFQMGQVIAHRTVASLLESGFAQNVYLEAGFEFAFLIPPSEDGSFPEDVWDREGFAWHDIHRLFAIDNIETFLEVHYDPTNIFGEPLEPIFVFSYPFTAEDIWWVQGERVEITFMEGFDKSDFSLERVYDFDSTVPIILRYDVAEEHGLGIGDMAFLSHNFENIEPWRMNVQVVGIYSGRMHRSMAYEASLFPLSALEPIREVFAGSEYADILTGYITTRFEVKQTRNREITEFREILEEIVSHPRAGAAHLTFDLFDGELEFVVRQMEQNIHIIRLLYPVTIVVSLLIALGLSILLMFQNAKKIAVMRVLGTPLGKMRRMLVTEQIAVTLFGLVVGLGVFFLINSDLNLGASLLLFVLGYLGAALIGLIIGVVLASNRSPLELLQVKE